LKCIYFLNYLFYHPNKTLINLLNIYTFYNFLKFSENHANFELTGIICYWAAKYYTILKKYEGASSYWIIYMDIEIIKIKNRKDLIEKCLSLHLHPVLLLYNKLSQEDKPFDAKCSLINEEIIELIKYANCFDEENDLLYKSEKKDKNKLRTTNLTKFVDYNLEKNLHQLKDKLEMHKSKFKVKTDEDYQREFEEELRKMGK
jgi:hypothetical protein